MGVLTVRNWVFFSYRIVLRRGIDVSIYTFILNYALGDFLDDFGISGL